MPQHAAVVLRHGSLTAAAVAALVPYGSTCPNSSLAVSGNCSTPLPKFTQKLCSTQAAHSTLLGIREVPIRSGLIVLEH